MIESRCAIWIVAMAVVLLLVAAACGDDDDGSGANPERYCEIQAEFEQLDDPSELPPDEAREAILKARDLLDESVRVAPGEIRSSVESSVDSLMAVADLFEAADFDVEQVDPAELDALLEAVFSGEAVDAVDAWVTANCSA
jgi:hypothetical protein